jgi:hypothetical protein
MALIQDIMQNYFNENTLIYHFPSKEDLLSFDTLIVRLPYNQYIDHEYIRFIFEINLQFGIIEQIDQALKTWNDKSSQIVYIIKFSKIFRDSSSYMNACYNLLNWGYYDMCIIFAENGLNSTVRVFYDKIIGNAEKKIVDDVVESNVIENDIVERLKQIKTDIQENYEQFESIVESDINDLDDKTCELSRELEETKKELIETKRVVEDLKDQVKWMQKMFYHKVKTLESDLRDDFKEFLEQDNIDKMSRNKRNNKNNSRVRC